MVSDNLWLISSALAVLALGGLFYCLRLRTSKQTGPRQAISAVALETIEDILLPDGNGGQIYVEHLLLTCRGIVVVDVKEFQGTVFASDKMQEWTVIGEGRRFGFPNPQATLYDRIAAVRALVRNVPVDGHVLFRNDADFSKGRPKSVLIASELERQYSKPSTNELDRLNEAFSPFWDRLKAVAVPADEPA